MNIKRVLPAVFFAVLAQAAQATVDEVALAQLVRSDRQAEAQTLLNQANPTQADVLFFKGLVAQYRQDFPAAARFFAAAIDANPNHLNARRELASVLFQQEKYKQSKRQFKQLLRLDPSDEGRDVYQTFLNEISRRNPHELSGYFSFLPSTNHNRGSGRLIFDSLIGDFVIDPDSRAQSGVGVEAGVSGAFRQVLGGGSQNVFKWGFTGRWYEESKFNTAMVSLSFDREFTPNNQRLLGFGVHARHIWQGDEGDKTIFGGSLTAIQAFTPKDMVSFQLLHERRRYLYQSHNSGPYSKLFMRYAHQSNPSLGYHLSAQISSHRPRAEHAQYIGTRLEAGVMKSWAGGVVTGFSLFAGQNKYAEKFPLTGSPRHDKTYGISASLRHNKFNIRGFVPEVSCNFYKNGSNIAFYDYSVSECNLAITRRF